MATEDLAGDELLATIAEATGRTTEEVALDLWELEQAGVLEPLFDINCGPRNRAERRAASRGQR
jgi:hypothetical protein